MGMEVCCCLVVEALTTSSLSFTTSSLPSSYYNIRLSCRAPRSFSDLECHNRLPFRKPCPVSHYSEHVKNKTEKPISKQHPSDRISIPLSRITLGELLHKAGVSPVLINGDQTVEITGIQHDSRLICPGDLFVCCKGFSTDGHLHVSQAAEQGAVAIVATKQVSVQKTLKAFVQVEDTNSILSALSAAFYGHPSRKLTVVGITGTNGKTTTSYLLKSMFEAMGHKTGLLGTIAYYINEEKSIEASNTTPDALSLQCLMATMVRNGTKVCVMEVSSHALALGRCNKVDYNIAVFTNLTRDHMDFHETEQNYKMSKGLLFAKMVDPQQHRKVVNIDDQHAPYFTEQGGANVPVVKYSLENRDAHVFTSELKFSLFKTNVLVHTPKGNMYISSGLLGRHNVYNILTAVAVGIAADAPLNDIARGIEAVQAVPGRCELINEGQAFSVMVDYAHTPDALARLLDTTRECGARQVITVVGCGGDRDRGKRPIMAKMATDKSDVCILTSDNPRTEKPLSILDDMLAGVGLSMEEYLKLDTKKCHYLLHSGHRLIVCENRSLAIRTAIAMGEEGDAVVVAGKGHETYQIIGNRKEHFDDREECRKALKHLNRHSGYTFTGSR